MSQEDSLKVKIGSRIRTIRQARSMTGKDLASATGISQPYLSEVERGLSEVSGAKLFKIATALGTTVQTLMSDDGGSEGENSQAPQRSISIPFALSEAAEELKLPFSTTMRVLQGYQTLTARRSDGMLRECTKQDWISFYQNVKSVLEDEE